MYCLVPNHTTPGKRSVTISIQPADSVLEYRLQSENMVQSEFSKGNLFEISRNGNDQLEIRKSSQESETLQFTISFLKGKPKFDGGDGSAAHPYRVSTLEQLNAMRLNLSAHYVLTSDIDLSQWGITWVPIGKYVPQGEDLDIKKAFSGAIDGAGFKLLHLCCDPVKGLDRAKNIGVGFIGCCIDATLKNLNLEACRVSGNTSVGCLAGEAIRCSFVNCHAVGIVKGVSYVGGMSGGGRDSRFSLCSFSGKLSAEYDAAGLCVKADYISNCEVNAEISSFSPCGLCSSVTTQIEYCIVRGVLSGCTNMSGVCCSMGTNTKVIGCICALNRVEIHLSDIFTSHPSYLDISPHERRFSAIDQQDCTDSEYMNTEYRNNFYRSGLQFDGTKDWDDHECMDGFPILDEHFRNRTFLESLSWDFKGIWDITEHGPILKKNAKWSS